MQLPLSHDAARLAESQHSHRHAHFQSITHTLTLHSQHALTTHRHSLRHPHTRTLRINYNQDLAAASLPNSNVKAVGFLVVGVIVIIVVVVIPVLPVAFV